LVLYRSMHPLIAFPIPGAVVIITSPVSVDSECNYWNTEPGRVRVERNVTALVLVSDVRRVEPAAAAVEGDIAPTPIIEAAHNLDGRISVELSHFRI
jgi:hypothetical protein